MTVPHGTETRTCPECHGGGIVEEEDDFGLTWLDTCQLCDGDGEIEVEPIEMEDLDG